MPRIAVIDPKLCFPLKCNLECVKNCPVNRVGKDCLYLVDRRKKKGDVTEQAPEHVTKREYTNDERMNSRAEIDPGLCTGCGICPKVCPFHAITIVNLAEAKEEERVFSYGYNAFGLYRMAIPRKGLIAVVGENGCGKSTNLKLLAKQLTPQRMPTKEIQEYFKALDEKRVVWKPQELNAVRSGKNVEAVLKGIDEADRLRAIERVFDLKRLYGRKLDELSGGELQQVTVAAALLREKETYLLDEPFAFMDYTYRIRLIEYLKNHFAEKNVLLVDHDISLLSYVCPQAHVLYGTPAAYGIVSQVYGTDRAINMFLEGFIGPENVRFRKDSLAYRHYAEEQKKNGVLTLAKTRLTRGSFEVENRKEVLVRDGEIIGIAGPNGIGKSTWMQALHEKNEARTAMKTQLLVRDDELVANTLTPLDLFAETFVRTMDLKRLEFLRTSDLSGGELQKLRIYEALNQEKSVYVLDEPTNMLDVSGRIRLSKMLRERVKEGRAVLLVDHDLEFLFNTVDRVIVMEGESGVHGEVKDVYDKHEGAKVLLKQFGLTYRKDGNTERLKLNKPGSRKDAALKKSKEFIEVG
ncbi:ATP-binding cassette domain-containing protein [Candidatus Micrarchaeota archaeon]|nr:ATP-binding cassette domain-containing protein [Candidatus Micrarchaeota archaeon]